MKGLRRHEAVAFNNAWDRLAAQGACDSRGGVEYTRVIQEWSRYDGTATIEQFIRTRANIGATVPTAAQADAEKGGSNEQEP